MGRKFKPPLCSSPEVKETQRYPVDVGATRYGEESKQWEEQQNNCVILAFLKKKKKQIIANGMPGNPNFQPFPSVKPRDSDLTKIVSFLCQFAQCTVFSLSCLNLQVSLQ